MEEKNAKYAPVHVIRTEEGLVGTVTGRPSNGRRVFTFSIRKEYDRDGVTYYTSWLQKAHFEGMRKLLDQLEDAITLEEDKDRASARKRG
jgi:hypothetical protein